jgi:hypothetical protein
MSLVQRYPYRELRNLLVPSRILPGAGRNARRVGTAIATAILGSSLALAGQSTFHNADYWEHLPKAQRLTYIEGYSDAMQVSVKKLDSLRIAAELFHWKGAKQIFGQAAREMMISGVRPNDLVHYMDKVYSDPEYHDLEVVKALQLAAIKGDLSASESCSGTK